MLDAHHPLTEKEKQALRLLTAGHDAKSIAVHLGLSVHTVNERLRETRRKLGTSSSREAARLLLEREAPVPQNLVDMVLGADPARDVARTNQSEASGENRSTRPRWIIGGFAMSIMFIAFALAIASAPEAASPPPAAATTENATVAAARTWLELLDTRDWNATYQATGAAFRSLNTAATWAAASDKARAPLGAALSRDLISVVDVPAPPGGYWMVKFRTRFANRPEAIETVSVEREAGAWRVVGVTIE